MSRHRIKNIDYEDDDYAENDEGDYAEDTEISPEDREQMKLKTVEVQQLLQSEIPPVLASEEEIWESLWHYYYDVDKTVTYIRSKLSNTTSGSLLCGVVDVLSLRKETRGRVEEGSEEENTNGYTCWR